MRASLHEIEVAQACTRQIETYKRKLHTHKSLSKGGSILAINALQRIGDKRRKEADNIIHRAKRAITRIENKSL
jgi:hypothetical protein